MIRRALILAMTMTVLAAPSYAAKSSYTEKVSNRNVGGMSVTYWFTHIAQPSGPDTIIPTRVDVCGVEAGESAYPYFRASYDGLTFAPTFVPAATEGCTTYVVSPTSEVKVGYVGGQPRTELVLSSTQGAGFWAWAVTGSTGQPAPTVRPLLSDPPLSQDFVQQ